jgi:hypothetical protein
LAASAGMRPKTPDLSTPGLGKSQERSGKKRPDTLADPKKPG